MPPTLSAQEFVAKWRHVSLKESASAQQHFLDICRLIGHSTPAESDPTGDTFTFEAGASKSSGGNGFADVWKKGFFAWEYKGKHADLDQAYRQLQQYREALENPPLLVVSDIDQIVVHTNFTNTVKQATAITLDDLLRPDGLARVRSIFFSPNDFLPHQTTAQVTSAAAAKFARLAEILRQYGEDPQQAAHFLIRLLFCLFAEDIGLLPNGIFSRLIETAHSRSSAFAQQLRQLFAAMSTGGWFGTEEIIHFDGGLFDGDTVLELDSEGLAILRDVSKLDWSSIEPAILGTLFERSLDPGKRSQLGAHYTSREDILLIVEPVLMAPLRRKWAEVKTEVKQLARRRDQASGAQRTRLDAQLRDRLSGFAGELGRVQVLDPACGSGNFLYVSLRQLLELWKEISTLGSALGLPLLMPFEGSSPHPAQLHGIEINAYAHELAQTTVWIGYLQWAYENGFGAPTPPVLKRLETVLQMDAVLSYDAEGRLVEPAWPDADVIIGNPPFLGGNRIRKELGDKYTEDLFALYRGRVPAFADLVCYWFEKARAQIESGRAGRAGLLATQGIRGGANREVLRRIQQSGDIFWAQSDRNWILDGAAVHVSMIGFDDGTEPNRELDHRPVATINSDLTSATDVTQAATLGENAGICFMGPSAKAPFDIDSSVADSMLSAAGNVNGRPNSEVVRPVASAVDLVGCDRRKWTIDFALMLEDQAAQYELPFEYVKQVVRPVRSNNRRRAYAQKWWQYAEPRPGMRAALCDRTRFLATPGVSKHRIFVWVTPQVLCNQGTLVFARDDDYFFGVLQCRVHELWARRKGTQLREAESGARYTPTTTFETFPFPWPPNQEPWGDPRLEAIASAAHELSQQRDRWLNPEGASADELRTRTLTNLYNLYPRWLELAHRRLDDAVFDAYGWPHDLTDDEILARLLALNLSRSAAEAHHE